MLIFLYSALIVVFDQLFKQWILVTHEVGQETILIPGFFSLFHLENPGAAFGFMAGLPWWVLAVFQLAASIALVMIILRYTEGFWGSLGLASVLGGAVGNLVDRIIHNHVVDMFRFTFIDFAIFNLADVFITLGFLMFLIHFIVYTFRSDKNEEALADGDELAEYSNGYDAVTQVEPIVYDAPIVEVEPVGQPVAQVAPHQAPQALPQSAPQIVQQQIPQAAVQAAPQQIPQAVPQTVEQRIPQAVSQVAAQATPQQYSQPVAPQQAAIPAPQAVPALPGDMTQQVDPMAIFAGSPTSEPSMPSAEPPITTGPLPTKEIAPLLDHVYGGQYMAKLQEGTTPPIAPAPVSQAAPVAVPAPVAPVATVAPEPIPEATLAPVASPGPMPEAVLETVPVDVTSQPVPTAQVAPNLPTEPAIAQSVTAAPLEPTAPANAIVSDDDGDQKDMLGALTALESELLGESASDDYNADKLLGEYGFESEEKDS